MPNPPIAVQELQGYYETLGMLSKALQYVDLGANEGRWFYAGRQL